MKLMFPKNSFVGTLLAFFIVSLIFTNGTAAQSKKTAKPKATVAKKSQAKAKDVKKDRDKAKLSAKDAKKAKAKDSKREKLTAKDRSAAKDKLTAKEKAKADSKSKKDPKKLAEQRQAAAERRRKEAEFRAAILAERRRREQARREAIARKIAFEKGLRTETVANIASDKTDGEDLAIRQTAINALGSNAGSVVVMEAQTGKVLTIVNQGWAVRSSVKPCSVIKLVTAVAGLNEGHISKEDGALRNVSTRRHLDDATAFSDNGYFQRVGGTVGNAKMIEYARQLGLGEPTGHNSEGESSGRLAIGNNNPRIYSHGDDFETSPLQLAVMVSAITNGGMRVIPRTPRMEVEKTNFQPFIRKRIDVPQVNVRRVIPGMMGAAEYGTARRNMDQSLGVAGKTGSCIGGGSWVGLFASVAPIEKPKYAVVVVTRGQRQRGRIAAAIAAQIYRALAKNIVRTDRNLAQTEFRLPPRNGFIPVTVAAAEEVGEEEDESGIAGMDTDGREVIVVPSAIRVPVVQPAKKLITKTGDSKPVLPPVVITYDKDGDQKRK